MHTTSTLSRFPLPSLLVLLLGSSLFFSCAPCAIQKGTKGNALRYEVKKGPCFGTCPVYNMYIFADGEALLYAINFVDEPGIYTRMLSKDEYKMLCTKYKKAKWPKLKEHYGRDVVDLPSVYLTAYDKKGDKKTVLAKDNFPETLTDISNTYEQIRTGATWKKIFIDPAKEHFDTRWLVVNLHGEEDLNTLESKYARYGLKRGDRIVPKLNYWEVTYDYENTPGELIFYLLRKDPTVKEVAYLRANVREPKAKPDKS